MGWWLSKYGESSRHHAFNAHKGAQHHVLKAANEKGETNVTNFSNAQHLQRLK